MRLMPRRAAADASWPGGALARSGFNLTVGIFFAWLVVEADAELPGMLAWFSSFRFVRFVGKTSYGIYLTHVFFLKIFSRARSSSDSESFPLWTQGLVTQSKL
jgi:peptidoglycan/LPS O-acetylase OafA/YrhL